MVLITFQAAFVVALVLLAIFVFVKFTVSSDSISLVIIWVTESRLSVVWWLS